MALETLRLGRRDGGTEKQSGAGWVLDVQLDKPGSPLAPPPPEFPKASLPGRPAISGGQRCKAPALY